jgi:hypothetical protein
MEDMKTKYFKFQISNFKWLIAFMAVAFGVNAQQTDSSLALESSHLFRNSRGTALYELNAYNSSGSTVYLQLYDSYTAAVPATAHLGNASWNVATGVVTTGETHTTWATGTRFIFYQGDDHTAAVASEITPLFYNRRYYLIKITSSTFKLSASLSDALAGRSITLGGTPANDTWDFTVNLNPLPPIQVPTKSTASLGFHGREFSDGIWAVFSTTDTSYTAATAIGLFDASYR